MKIRLVVMFVGLAIGFCLPTFAQQTTTFQKVFFANALTTGDQNFPCVGAAGNELSVIGRWLRLEEANAGGARLATIQAEEILRDKSRLLLRGNGTSQKGLSSLFAAIGRALHFSSN